MDEVHDTFRPSLGGWLRGTAAGLAPAGLGIAGIVLTVATAGDWGAWPLGLTALALVVVFIKWLEAMSAKYEVTAERLIVRRGILMKSIDEIELYRVKDVRMNFSLLNQTAGIGTICLTTSDETTRAGDLIIRQVPNAQRRREELRRVGRLGRRPPGGREIDMVHDDF